MTTPVLRDILVAVREGRLDPAEAARLLAAPAEATPAPAGEVPMTTGPHDLPPAVAAGDDAVGTGVPASDEGPAAHDGPATNDGPAAHDGSAADCGRAPDDGPAFDDGPAEAPAEGGFEGSAPDSDIWAQVVDDPDVTAAPPPTAPAPTAPVSAPTEDGAGEPTARPPSAAVVRTTGDAPATEILRVRAMTRRVRIIADAAVTTVSVEGPHELRREGTTLILESDRDLPFGDPFSFLPAMRGGFRLQPGKGIPLSLGNDLVVRLNPAIHLDVDVTAGSLAVRGVSQVRARVTAGSARIDDVTGPLDLHVVGGTAKVDMTVRGGDNRIRCESGSISLRLRRDSNVRMRPDAQLGRITIDGEDGGREIAIGAGTGRLDVEIVMGNLQVEVER